MAAADPDRYYYADQYSNDANWRAHYQNGTADEIWRQTEGRVTHFVATIGATFTRSESPVEADSIALRAKGPRVPETRCRAAFKR